jgi:hypothetical protein
MSERTGPAGTRWAGENGGPGRWFQSNFSRFQDARPGLGPSYHSARNKLPPRGTRRAPEGA